MSQPRVSIVVCTYNNAATLARTLESLAAQDYPNFHIVVVDDCSADNSVAVAQDHAARFPGIIRSVKNEKNLGLVGNYSSAHRFFEGELFMLGGPDDTWAPNFLSRMVEILQHNPRATLAMSSVRSQFDDGESDVYAYDMLSDHKVHGGAPLACAIVNGVDAKGAWSVPFNSFIHGVGRSRAFAAALPNDAVYWYIELQIVAMFALLGGLVTTREPLYLRHRFRQSWEERYPDDTYLPAAMRFWPRMRSAFRFAGHALGCKELSARAKLSVPKVTAAIILFQVLRPALAPQLKKILPRNAVAAMRSVVYRFTNASK